MSNTPDIQREVDAALGSIRHPRGRPIVVGISGGVDSQVLAHALVQVTRDSGPDLHAVHVDHQLRKSSAEDAARVAAFCDELGLPCDVETVDVEKWDRHLRQGTESAARAARYAVLCRAAIDAGTDTVAVGHTLDDQAETVLLRLMAGTGLEGLGGMDRISRRRVQLEPDGSTSRRFAIFRPLLNVKRADIEKYAQDHSLVPVEDETNQSLVYRRNAVRRTVLPAMESIEPSTKDAISRTASMLRDDIRFINDTVDETFDEVVAERAGVWMVERQQFRHAYQAIQRRLLFRIVEPLIPARSRLSGERIDALREAAVDGRPGTIIELTDKLVAYVDYDRVAIGNVETLEDDLRRLSWIPLIDPGSEVVLSGSVDVELDNGWRVRGEAPEGDGWVLRTRRDGDRTRNDRGRVVKLQDWLVDRRVPRYVRDWLPVVVQDGEIRWVIGLDVTEFSDTAANIHLHLELNVEPRPVE